MIERLATGSYNRPELLLRKEDLSACEAHADL
jgi:hypothetical protein